MPFVTTKQMLKNAQASHVAIGAFNVENLEMAHAVIAAASEMGCPVILATTHSTAKYAPLNVYTAMVKTLAESAPVPVALHMDHASAEYAVKALAAGYTSVMYDGSREAFDVNISETTKIVEAAAAYNIPVEAELGSVGGKEDDVEADAEYTDPKMAADFVARTGVDSLAVAIGTAHGIYSGEPKLDIARLKEIRQCVSVPLVLHGASGLSAEAMRDCIRAGICKINFGTDLRLAYTDAIKAYMNANPKKFDPRTYGKAGFEAVKAAALEKMAVISNV